MNVRQYFVKVEVTSWMPGEDEHQIDKTEVYQTEDRERVEYFGDEMRAHAEDMNETNRWFRWDKDGE